MYAVLTVPLGSEAGLSDIAEQFAMTKLYACVPKQTPLSVAVTEKLYVPVDVGVPERSPTLLKVNPGGNVPTVTSYEYGAVDPDAVND